MGKNRARSRSDPSSAGSPRVGGSAHFFNWASLKGWDGRGVGDGVASQHKSAHLLHGQKNGSYCIMRKLIVKQADKAALKENTGLMMDISPSNLRYS